MRDLRNKFLKLLTLLIFTSNSVLAVNCPSVDSRCYRFKDQGLEEGETIKLRNTLSNIEVHSDFTINNHWFNGVSGQNRDDNFAGFIDYRTELHAPLYNINGHNANLVTRVEGFGFYDENIDNFFDDPLIDVPEIFYQDDFKLKNNQATFSFGKFATRRYFDKDEITPDSFDIGEKPFFGVPSNANNLVNSINSRRDNDLFISTQATGSYGFYFGLKNVNPSGRFRDRWGFNQMLAVSRLDNFNTNFYSASEINKNWGTKNYHGQFNLGMIAAADSEVFKINSPDDDESFLFYGSLIQRVKGITPYFRWGQLFSRSNGNNYVDNLISTGVFYKITKNDVLTSHLVYRNSDSRVSSDSNYSLVNFWRHQYNEHLASFLFIINNFGVANGNSPDGEDNNTSIGFNLAAFY